jgi:hypothetical protein
MFPEFVRCQSLSLTGYAVVLVMVLHAQINSIFEARIGWVSINMSDLARLGGNVIFKGKAECTSAPTLGQNGGFNIPGERFSFRQVGRLPPGDFISV